MESVEDVMLELAWKRFSDVWQDKRDVETKASILLTASSITLGLIINAIDNFSTKLWLIPGILLVMTIIFCVIALKPREYFVFGLKKSWDDFEKYMDDLVQLKLEIYGALAIKEKHNTSKISEAAKWLEKATYSFLFGVVLTIGIISLFFFY